MAQYLQVRCLRPLITCAQLNLTPKTVTLCSEKKRKNMLIVSEKTEVNGKRERGTNHNGVNGEMCWSILAIKQSAA